MTESEKALRKHIWKGAGVIITTLIAAFLLAFVPTVWKIAAFHTEIRLVIVELRGKCDRLEKSCDKMQERIGQLETRCFVQAAKE